MWELLQVGVGAGAGEWGHFISLGGEAGYRVQCELRVM